MRGKERGQAAQAAVERVRRRFEQWRRLPRKPGRRRIPESLWRAAVEVARVHGTYRAARELRLDYRRLKDRVKGSGQQGAEAATGRGAEFVELTMAPALAGGASCVVEVENDGGSRMRIEVQGAVPPELADLVTALWRSRG